MKKEVKLINWDMNCEYDSEYFLSGIAVEHPKLGKNIRVAYTSYIEDIKKVENTVYYFETRNTIYKCDTKYMSTGPLNDSDDIDFTTMMIERAIKNEQDSEIKKIHIHSLMLKLCYLLTIDVTGADKKLEQFGSLMNYGSMVDKEYFENLVRLHEIGEFELEERKQKEEAINLETLRQMLIANNEEEGAYIELGSISTGNSLAYIINENSGIIRPLRIECKGRPQFDNEFESMMYSNEHMTLSYSRIYESSAIEIKAVGTVKNVYIKNTKKKTIICNDIVIKSDETKKVV